MTIVFSRGIARSLRWIVCMVPAVCGAATVVEYFNPDLDNYFITADPTEQAFVDTGAVGRWQRTGNSFPTGGPNQVCRFYGNANINPATGRIFGPNSHFYTADPVECAGLKAQFSATAKSWKFESNDFATTPAVNGACAPGLAPIFRAYNNGFARGIDSNHRITPNLQSYQQAVAAGWVGEGVVMCASGTMVPALLLSQDGTIVYDPANKVAWLANANLAGDPAMRAAMGVGGIDANGAMDFSTAQKWVAALNAYNGGAGYLGHNNWQLPVSPLQDASCADVGSQGGSFGPLCTGSAMGGLYYTGLGQSFPNSVAPRFAASVGPARNVKLSYYWALQNDGGTGSGVGGGGQEVFSFGSGTQGGVTTKDLYFYAWPMVPAALAGAPACPSGSTALLPYSGGPAAGQALYDCGSGYTWLADANLAATNGFGVAGTTTIVFGQRSVSVPLIDSGAMLFATANQWVQAMNAGNYLGSAAWQLPASAKVLQGLFDHLGLAAQGSPLAWTGAFGPFLDLQPFFYWGCQRDQSGSSQSPCTGYAPPDGTRQLQWTFNFDQGFQSTSAVVQKYFVIVYYPAPGP